MLEEVIMHHSNTILPFNLPVQSMQQLQAAGQGGGSLQRVFLYNHLPLKRKKKAKNHQPLACMLGRKLLTQTLQQALEQGCYQKKWAPSKGTTSVEVLAESCSASPV